MTYINFHTRSRRTKGVDDEMVRTIIHEIGVYYGCVSIGVFKILP